LKPGFFVLVFIVQIVTCSTKAKAITAKDTADAPVINESAARTPFLFGFEFVKVF
tara:strand:+ start:58247 stop:58411 length:165 start_codon:yes stop_codon:yes gene_type:complete